MTHDEAMTLPPCPECGCPTALRRVASLLTCTSGLCDWTECVDDERPPEKPEPLRFNLSAALLRAFGDKS